MIKTPIAAVVIAVALLGGFYGGLKIGQSNASASNSSSNTGAGSRTGTGGFAGFGAGAAACTTPSPGSSGSVPRRATTGTITAVNGNTMTIHDARCNTNVTVTFDQSVIIRKTVDGTASDLTPNTMVAVAGTRQSDGSIKANTITLGNFANFRFGGANATGAGG
jgi:hypothetical protein